MLEIPENAPAAPQGNALFLDGISDPGNLGTIIRTANGAGYADIYLKNCTDPYAPKCVRSAMSGLFFVRLHFLSENVYPFLDGIPFICADMGGENVYSFRPPQKFVLVIGNEANGVSRGNAESLRIYGQYPDAGMLREPERGRFGGYFDVSFKVREQDQLNRRNSHVGT